MSTAGVLRAALAVHPGGPHVLDSADLPPGGVAVVALPSWTPAQVAELGAAAATAGAVAIPLRHDGALTLVGPVVGPGLPGCLACAEDARLRTLGALPGERARLTFGGAPVPATLPLLAALVTDIAGDPAGSAGTLWVLRGSDGAVTTHRVLPRPGCPTCRPVPDDDQDAARFTPVPRPVPGDELRQPNRAATLEALRAELVDRRLGPVERVLRTEGLPLPLAAADFTVDAGRHMGGYGRARGVAEAERTALFEAVERQLGMRPHGRKTVLTASFAELGADRAIDPATLGQHDPRYFGHPAFRLTPYHPDLRTRWVHGWSLTTRRAVAVPEHVAYWGTRAREDAPRFLDESSNGCGLGNSLEEAVLYGLLEVAERDAFLMAWYARTSLRRIAPPADDPVVPHLADRLDPLGYDLMFFNASNDFGVPAVVSLALHRDPGSGVPQVHFAAGAHPDPRTALRSAAAEVAVAVYAVAAAVRQRPDHLDRDRLLGMLADPTKVRTIDDHVAVHTLPDARSRYEFLFDGGEPVDWRELWPGPRRPVADLTVLLTGLVDGLAEAGLETIVVDQTDPWTRDRLGLHAAKVIVPGALPMTFGHVHHRTRDLPRLLHVPARLGRLPAVPAYADLPLHPHPFP